MTREAPLFTVKGFLKLTRTWNIVIMSFTQIMVALFIFNETLDSLMYSTGFVILMISTGMVAAAGYIINDYYDVKIDYVNKPERVVIGRYMKRRTAMVLHLSLTFLALLLGVFISWSVFFVHLLSSFFLWVYSNQLKRLPFIGNVLVGILTGLCVFVVGIFYGSYPWSLYVYAGFAFFFTLIREIIKDLEDRYGDARYGCKTLPVIWGVSKTKVFVLGLMVLFTFTLVFVNYPWVSFYKNLYIGVIIFLEMLIFSGLYRADKIADFRRLSAFSKGVIVLGVLSMFFNKGIQW